MNIKFLSLWAVLAFAAVPATATDEDKRTLKIKSVYSEDQPPLIKLEDLERAFEDVYDNIEKFSIVSTRKTNDPLLRLANFLSLSSADTFARRISPVYYLTLKASMDSTWYDFYDCAIWMRKRVAIWSDAPYAYTLFFAGCVDESKSEEIAPADFWMIKDSDSSDVSFHLQP